MRLSKILTLIFLFGSFPAWAAQDFDFQVEPTSGDNFLEAAFRFTNPEPGKVPERILIYIPGTDGDARGIVDDPAFLQACRKCHAALVGCYFRGEGLSYDTPGGGSGNALDKALASFAAQTGQPQLAQLPLLLMGFSQGSQFTFNYVCWHPDRIAAFAAIKAGGFALTPKEESFQVPGLLVAGQYDEPGRIRNTAKAFMSSRGKNSKWAFLFEKGAGHDISRIGSFALEFLDAVCANAGAVVYRHAGTGESVSSPSSDADVCWFPDEATSTMWNSLQQRTPLAELARMPDPGAVESVVQVTINPSCFRCTNGQRQDGTIMLSSSAEGVSVQNISVSGLGFALTGPAGGRLPLQATFSFAPVDFDWGPVSTDITISGQQSGHELAPEIITLHSVVQGPVTPVPRLLYLGISYPHETVRKTIRLKVPGSAAHIAKITSPSDMIAKSQEIPGTDDLALVVTWTPSNRLGSMSGEIRIDLDQPEKGTLRIPVVGMVERR